MQIQKTTILLVFLFISTISFSQIEKGNIILGGNLNGAVNIERNNIAFSTSPSISGGYFLSDNFLLKSNIYYSYYKRSDRDRTGTAFIKTQNLGFGAGVRYYWNNTHAQPFLGASSDFSFGMLLSNNFFSYIRKLTPKVDFGINYFINENVALEFQIPISYDIILFQTSMFDLRRLNVNPGIGFQIFLTQPQKDRL